MHMDCLYATLIITLTHLNFDKYHLNNSWTEVHILQI